MRARADRPRVVVNVHDTPLLTKPFPDAPGHRGEGDVRLLATLLGPPGTGDHCGDILHGVRFEPGQPAAGKPFTFLVSIAAAAILLLTLPEITQNLRTGQNIWLTRDSIAGQLLRTNTQGLALVESIFFGCGFILLTTMIVVMIWSPAI
jgi:hypothetical protein